MTVINNEFTKQQIRNWLEESIRKAQNTDPKEVLKRVREKRKKQVARFYGL